MVSAQNNFQRAIWETNIVLQYLLTPVGGGGAGVVILGMFFLGFLFFIILFFIILFFIFLFFIFLFFIFKLRTWICH